MATRSKLDNLGGHFANAIQNENKLDCQQLVIAFDIFIAPAGTEYDTSGLTINHQSLYTTVQEAVKGVSEGTEINELVRQCREQVANGNIVIEFDNGFLRRANSLKPATNKLSMPII